VKYADSGKTGLAVSSEVDSGGDWQSVTSTVAGERIAQRSLLLLGVHADRFPFDDSTAC